MTRTNFLIIVMHMRTMCGVRRNIYIFKNNIYIYMCVIVHINVAINSIFYTFRKSRYPYSIKKLK